jgi:hypothetical protein
MAVDEQPDLAGFVSNSSLFVFWNKRQADDAKLAKAARIVSLRQAAPLEPVLRLPPSRMLQHGL